MNTSFNKKYLIILCFSLYTTISFGQDIHFSQIFETPLLRNPALAGLFSGDVRVQTVYRSQWTSFTNAYKTVSGNVEYKVPVGQASDFITIGGQVLYDRAGDISFTSTHLLPAINFHKNLSEEKNMYLSLAFMGGYVQRRVDRSKITTNNQFDGTTYNPTLATGETFANPNFSYLDGTVGMSFNAQLGDNIDNNLYVGLAYHHLNKSKKITFYSNSKIELTPKWVASAGIRNNLTDYSYLTFEGDFSKQGAFKETIVGLLVTQKLDDPESPTYLIHGGAYVRFNDAIIPVIKLENRPIAIAVSYDINISGLKRASTGRGGYEVSLTYQKFLDRDNSSLNAIKCPKF